MVRFEPGDWFFKGMNNRADLLVSRLPIAVADF